MPELSALEELAQHPEVVLLAAGRAHTDESAERAISALGYDGRMIETLRRFGYLVRTGPEWRLESSLREAVLSHHAASERAADPLWVSAHQHYFSVARTGGSEDDPFYLVVGPGYAYHASEFDLATGLEGYSKVALVDSLAISVESLQMANEQGRRGLLDLQADPLLFLRGMTYYRQGRVVEAVELLRRVSRADDQTAEVAIAQHLVARMDCERGGADEVAEARKMFKLSLANARSRGDKIHQSHAEHSLAICLLSQRRPDTERAVQLLESALALTRETGDEWGQAKVLHTLGQVLSRYPKSRGQALQYLQRSRDIGAQLGFTKHVGKVDESIARAKGVAAASGAAEGKLKSKSAPRRRARRQRRS